MFNTMKKLGLAASVSLIALTGAATALHACVSYYSAATGISITGSISANFSSDRWHLT